MTTIRALHEVDPGFPATAQHQDAVRYPVVAGIFRFADCVGGAPIQSELDAVIGADAAGQAAAARQAADKSEAAAHKVNPDVQAFLNFTEADLDGWIATFIEAAPLTLAQVKTNLGVAFRVLGRLAQDGARGKSLRNGL